MGGEKILFKTKQTLQYFHGLTVNQTVVRLGGWELKEDRYVDVSSHFCSGDNITITDCGGFIY